MIAANVIRSVEVSTSLRDFIALVKSDLS